MITLKLRKFGRSVGVIFPKEVLSVLPVGVGYSLFLTGAPGSFRITPYDPEFERQMATARDVMKTDRNLLRELAKK